MLFFAFIEPVEVELANLSERRKEILKTTWGLIYGELGQTLYYIGGKCEKDENAIPNPNQGLGRETFLRLFEEYPMSRQFFRDFRGTSVEAIKSDVKLSQALQEHAVRVLRVVEKVIGRIDNLEKVNRKVL